MPGSPYNNVNCNEGFVTNSNTELCDVNKTYKCPLNNSCGVKWNDGTSTYICECHGDEWDISGQVIKGRSLDNLTC